MSTACDDCLRRTDLIAALAGWLDVEWRRRDAPGRVLARCRRVAARRLRGTRRSGRATTRFDPAAARAEIRDAGLAAICRCDDAYPERLRDLADPPAVLHVAGDPSCVGVTDAVAVVGARRATPYGLTVARELGRGLSAAGVQRGLRARRSASTPPPTPARSRARRRRSPCSPAAPTGRIRPPSASCTRRSARSARSSSEMPPGFGIHRWAFVARNRLIAALAQVVVVVEATERSGSLTTADLGAELGRTVAAVPGRVTCAVAAGHERPDPRRRAAGPRRPRRARRAGRADRRAATRRAARRPRRWSRSSQRLLDAIGAGHSTLPMLAAHGLDAARRAGRARRARGARPRSGAASEGATSASRYDRAPLFYPEPRERASVPAVLSIAGSDSGGGAGIQADLKAFARCGVHGMTAIAALTAQNTVAVTGIHPVPGAFIVEQVRAVAEDIGVDAVKIGMLGTADTVRAVREALDAARARHPDRARPRDGRRVGRRAARRAGPRGDRRASCCRASP